MPKKKKSNNADQKIARKRADELVIRGNEQLQEVAANRRAQNAVAALAALDHAEATFSEAANAMSGAHLDSAYSLGVCCAMRADIQQRQGSHARQVHDHRKAAARHFEAVIAADTSRRSETLELAHCAYGALLAAQAASEPPHAADALLSRASDQLARAHEIRGIRLGTALADSGALMLQWGDVFAAAMMAAIAAGSAPAVQVRTLCTEACARYDRGLAAAVADAGAGAGAGDIDISLLEQKVRALHGYLAWREDAGAGGGGNDSVATQALVDDALGSAVGLTQLLGFGMAAAGAGAAAHAAGPTAAVAGVGATVGSAAAVTTMAPARLAPLLVVCGDVCNMIGTRAAQEQALALYERAAAEAPNAAEPVAAAADVLFEVGKAVLHGGAGSVPSGHPPNTDAVALLQRAQHAFERVLQLAVTPPDREYVAVASYNLACLAALRHDEAACHELLGRLRRDAAATGGSAAERELLADIAADADFAPVAACAWFNEALRSAGLSFQPRAGGAEDGGRTGASDMDTT
eukprot:g1138.t1